VNQRDFSLGTVKTSLFGYNKREADNRLHFIEMECQRIVSALEFEQEKVADLDRDLLQKSREYYEMRRDYETRIEQLQNRIHELELKDACSNVESKSYVEPAPDGIKKVTEAPTIVIQGGNEGDTVYDENVFTGTVESKNDYLMIGDGESEEEGFHFV
jgi:hypothetical protein